MSATVYMPVKCVWGKNALSDNASLLSGLGKRCLILTGGSGAKKSGALADAESALEKEGIGFCIFDGIGENPLISVCRQAGKGSESRIYLRNRRRLCS